MPEKAAHGYRCIHKKLLAQELNIPIDRVRVAWTAVNDASKSRYGRRMPAQSRVFFSAGPNATWHIDGHDKLKSVGLYIHGCCDGASRYIMWMRVDISNRVPQHVLRFYLNAVRVHGIVPKKVVFDKGQENVLIGGVNDFLNRVVGDETKEYFKFTRSIYKTLE